MKSLAISLFAICLAASPALAADALRFGADFAPYRIVVRLHFPEGAGREHEADCTAQQVELFRSYFANYLVAAAPGLAAAFEGANGAGKAGTVLPLDFRVGCFADGGALITNFTPDQRWATQHYDPATGRWDIVG